MKLSNEEIARYSRHLVLSEFGAGGQLRLKASKVLVVGAGGLGSPVLSYLSSAGIGRIGIIDFDRIEVSNLQRQILFNEEDIGKNKAETAASRLKQKNSLVTYDVYPSKIEAHNALGIIDQYDIVVDGTDNFATRYLLNDACVLRDKVLVSASILKFEGHVSVFNAPLPEGRSCNYRDLFPVPPDPASIPNCEQAGVIGVLPGIIGALQANEVIKLISGIGRPLINQLLIVDSKSMEFYSISIKDKNSRSEIKGLIDYDEFCGLSDEKNKSLKKNQLTIMKEVTVQELKEMMDSGANFQLIDVREPHEFDICNLGGELIPQGEIPANVEKISKDKQVVIHCRSGARSGNMVQWLEKNHGYTNLYNLKGGILAWAREIDQEMPTY